MNMFEPVRMVFGRLAKRAKKRLEGRKGPLGQERASGVLNPYPLDITRAYRKDCLATEDTGQDRTYLRNGQCPLSIVRGGEGGVTGQYRKYTETRPGRTRRGRCRGRE